MIKDRFDSLFAEEVIYYTYNSDHINRYFSEDYLLIFRESSFSIRKFELTFHAQPTSEIQSKLEHRFPGYKQFSNNGILAFMQKYPINL